MATCRTIPLVWAVQPRQYQNVLFVMESGRRKNRRSEHRRVKMYVLPSITGRGRIGIVFGSCGAGCRKDPLVRRPRGGRGARSLDGHAVGVPSRFR